jgi:serine/threonine-protein kinase HipA
VSRIARLLRDMSGPQAVDGFGRAVVANYLLGSPDAHAKNYSVMLASSAVMFADLYDMASGLTATRNGRLRYPTSAMSLGGERAFGEMRAQNWTLFATALGVPADRVREWVITLAERAPAMVSTAIKGLPAMQRRQPELQLLARRVQRLSEMTIHGVNDASTGRPTGPSGPERLAATLP